MLKLDSVLLIDNVKPSSNNLENILLKYMQKKLDGTLEDQYDFDESEKVQLSIHRLKDIQAESYTDTRDIEMQDVMFEKRHILEEIDVELIPFEEFQAKAQPEFLVDLDNEHQLIINKLKYELVIRSELKKQQDELLKIKAHLVRENVKIKRKVDKFDKLLDDFVDSSSPVLQALEAEENAIALEVEKEKADAVAAAEKEKAGGAVEEQQVTDIVETIATTTEIQQTEPAMMDTL
ncbi:unnamed protein product [Rhizopus stolonifer]